MIMLVNSEHSTRCPMGGASKDLKWSRSLRVTVALASATASWAAVVGVSYLIAQIL
ncbi:hypothetical protein [Aliidongia dinghuensis]|uniref:hypothetical protein n=1 Tax=Aliidongia dinghuensis TaxID=1867774 RepID=UPI00166F36E2|nr:hypothetical protein [Aliidongia dinghuensis]